MLRHSGISKQCEERGWSEFLPWEEGMVDVGSGFPSQVILRSFFWKLGAIFLPTGNEFTKGACRKDLVFSFCSCTLC